MSELLDRIAVLKKAKQSFCIVTVVDSSGPTPRKAGARAIIFPDGSMEGTVGGGAIEVEAIKIAQSIIRQNKHHFQIFDLDRLETEAMICGGTMSLYFEPVKPSRVLTIFGGGHVGRSLARVANEAGWQIRVVDEREGIFETNYFPENAELTQDSFANFLAHTEFGSNDWIAIVTPRHKNDEQVLEAMIQSPVAYIGMMGSPKKVNEIKTNLIEKGISQEDLDNVHAPIGLNIGTETPGEIAISIVSEMLALLNDVQTIKSCSR